LIPDLLQDLIHDLSLNLMPDLIPDLLQDLIHDLLQGLTPDPKDDLTPYVIIDLNVDLLNVFHILLPIRKRRGRLSSQAVPPRITFRRSTLAPTI
jgi:hypothetical protein